MIEDPYLVRYWMSENAEEQVLYVHGLAAAEDNVEELKMLGASVEVYGPREAVEWVRVHDSEAAA